MNFFVLCTVAIKSKRCVNDFVGCLDKERSAAFHEHHFANGVTHRIAYDKVRSRGRNLDGNAAVNGGPFFGVHHMNRIRTTGPKLFGFVEVNGQGIARNIAAEFVTKCVPVRVKVYDKVGRILDACKCNVRQFVRFNGERNILVVIRVALEAHANVVVSRRQSLSLRDGLGVDGNHREIVAYRNAAVVGGIERLESDTVLVEALAVKRKVRRAAFRVLLFRACREVASENRFAHQLPHFLDNQLRVVRQVREEHACFGLQVHRSAHLEVRFVAVTFGVEDVEGVSFARN